MITFKMTHRYKFTANCVNRVSNQIDLNIRNHLNRMDTMKLASKLDQIKISKCICAQQPM